MRHDVVIHQLRSRVDSAPSLDADFRRAVRLIAPLAEITWVEATRLLYSPQAELLQLAPEFLTRLTPRERVPVIQPTDIDRPAGLLFGVEIGIGRQVVEVSHGRSPRLAEWG